MGDFTQKVESNNALNLGTAMNDVQLSTEQSGSSVVLFLEAAFEAGLAGLAASVTGGGAIVAAVVASGIDSAITDVSGAANPDYSTSIDSTAANLFQLIKNVYDDANTANGEYEDTILTDWGKLSTVSAAVSSGSLTWTSATNNALAAYASNAFDQYFYATL